MLQKISILLLLTYCSLQSQSITWESEYNIGYDCDNARYPVILDSGGNIVCTLDLNYSFSYYNFIKYDTLGNLLSSNNLLYSHTLKSMSLFSTTNGYTVFCATDTLLDFTNDNEFPAILKINNDGMILDSIYPYNIKNNNNFKDSSFLVEDFCNNTITFNGNFYNAFIKHTIPLDSNYYTYKDHIILTCFDSTGKIKWRKGYDTLASSGDHYTLKSIKLTDKGTLIFLLQFYKLSDDTNKQYNIKFIETDTEGNVLNDYVFVPNDKQFMPIDISRLTDDTYILLGAYILTQNNNCFLWKISTNGQIIKTQDIPNKYLYNNFSGIKKSPNDDIIIYGYLTVTSSGPQDNYDSSIEKLYMVKFNRDIEMQWDYEWYEHTGLNFCNINELIFLDNDNFIIIGCKDRFNYYIAKINGQTQTSVSDITDKQELSIYPNPFTNFLNIEFINNIPSSVSIDLYDILGNKIYTKNLGFLGNGKYNTKINPGLQLYPGYYLIVVRNESDTQSRKIFKVE